MYLREKSKKDFVLREEELRLKKDIKTKRCSFATATCINVTAMSTTVSSIDGVEE